MPEVKSAIVMMVNSDGFWTTNNAATLLKNSVFNDSLQSKAPIHYKLKDYVLTEGIEKVKKVSFDEKRRSPQRYLFMGRYIDDLAEWLMDRKHLEKALHVYQLNVELEPEQSGWTDRAGDAYRALGRTKLAIEWYKKALELSPDQETTREKLTQLSGKQGLKI